MANDYLDSKEGKAFGEAVVRRMMASALRGPGGQIAIPFPTLDDINAALIEVGISPINGQPLAENERPLDTQREPKP